MANHRRRRLTPLAMAVLSLLHEHPMHPYEMHQIIRDRHMDNIIKVRAGSLYHTVERLQELELIETIETARAGRRPERTVYAITDLGRDEFVADLRDLIQRPEPEYPSFGAALEMLGALDPDDVVDLFERRVVWLEALIAHHDQVLASLAKRGLPAVALTDLQYIQAVRAAELVWLNGTIDDIRSGTLRWQPPTPKTHHPNAAQSAKETP